MNYTKFSSCIGVANFSNSMEIHFLKFLINLMEKLLIKTERFIES